MSEVTIARHMFFYKTFFNKHKEFLDEFTLMEHSGVREQLNKLSVFHASYSYYMKEHEKDTHLKDMISERVEEFTKDKRYRELSAKREAHGVASLSYEELMESNRSFHNYLKKALEIFEIFTNRFAPSDIFPKLTENARDYDRTIVYVIYDTFYESLFNIHGKVHDKLMNFDITKFNDMFKVLMVFFYGYSYYIQKDTIKLITLELDKLYEFYNDETFLRAYFNLIQGNVNEETVKTVNEYKEKIFNGCILVYEMINGDLPKGNLFPKRAEKVVVDHTLI